MREREITVDLEIETPYGFVDWGVTVIYEYDGGIRINGVYDDHEHPEHDLWASLTKEQQGHVEQACIDDYADECDKAAAMAEDAADTRAQLQREEMAMRDNQRGVRL